MDKRLVAYGTHSESVFEVLERGKIIDTDSAVKWFRGRTTTQAGEKKTWIDRATWEHCKPKLTDLVHMVATRQLLAVEVINMRGGDLSMRGIVRNVENWEELQGGIAWIKILHNGRVIEEKFKPFRNGLERVMRAIVEAHRENCADE